MVHNDLIKECLKGNRQAQQLLYEHFAGTMFGICYRYTKSRDDAEDVLQEGFIKVFTRLHQYKNEGELGGWIRRIMVNTAINYIQKHNRYKKDLQTEQLTLHPVSNDNPEIQLNTKELVELIRELPTGYQTIFNLVAVEGYSHVEVAAILNMNENTIRSQYSRARAMLISMLKKTSDVNIRINYAGRV
jgi:RNA polymerase sigma-70 factor (ECF subfamily)